jgi:hypothetical protein
VPIHEIFAFVPHSTQKPIDLNTKKHLTNQQNERTRTKRRKEKRMGQTNWGSDVFLRDNNTSKRIVLFL